MALKRAADGLLDYASTSQPTPRGKCKALASARFLFLLLSTIIHAMDLERRVPRNEPWRSRAHSRNAAQLALDQFHASEKEKAKTM